MKSFVPTGRSQIPHSLLSLGRHFVYSEGIVSEMNYIKNIRDLIAKKNLCEPNDVLLFPIKKQKGKHTNDLIDFAIADVKDKCNKGNKPDCVWIFFDKDSFPDFDRALFRIAALNNSEKFNALNFPCDNAEIAWIPCWSNECLEVWYYYYLANLQSSLSRKDYLPNINSLLKNNKEKDVFTKSTEKPHDFLINHGGNLDLAIRFAKKKDPIRSLIKPNPSTGIYRFAEVMRPYFDQSDCSSVFLKK